MISYVRYGSLDVAVSARRDFDAAVAYLSRDPVERALFDRLEHGSQHITLTTNRHDADYYDPDTHVIHWDPHSALRTAAGGRQSPALGLGHEVDMPCTTDRANGNVRRRSIRASTPPKNGV